MIKYGIYFKGLRVWGNFKSHEQASNFINDYNLENSYEIQSY